MRLSLIVSVYFNFVYVIKSKQIVPSNSPIPLLHYREEMGQYSDIRREALAV